MTVLEDFESIADWNSLAATGTKTIQNTVRVVGNALEYSGAALADDKIFDVNEYGIYIRTDTAGAQAIEIEVYCQAVPTDAPRLRVAILANGNFVTFSGDGAPADTGETFELNTWYWVGFKRNSDHDMDIRIYNEAKTVEIFSVLGADGESNRAWPDGDSKFYLLTIGAKSYFDELTDEGTVPPPVGQYMVPKKYW